MFEYFQSFPCKDFEKHGIECIEHAPGVGQNLQDHLQFKITQYCAKPESMRNEQFKIYQNYREWKKDPANAVLTYAGMTTGAFVKTTPEKEHPDLQHHFIFRNIENYRLS